MDHTFSSKESLDVQADPSSGKHIFQLKGFEHQWGYAQALRVGQTVYVSGTVSIDANGNPTAVDDMAGQVRNVYADIGTCLRAHGATPANIVREALYTTDMNRFLAEGLDARAAFFTGHPLAAFAPWIEVSRLANPSFLFEAEVMAVIPST